MKKKLTNILVATMLVAAMVGITPAMATSVVPNSETPEAGEGTVSPRADQFETYYRTVDGVLQYRIWNATQGYWIMPWTYA